MIFSNEELSKQVTFKTSRSGGKGGQNVNKVSSKVELNLDIQACPIFTEYQKALLLIKLANRINSECVLQIITEEDRSQLVNKQISLEKLVTLLKSALHQPKIRKATKPGKGAVENRLKLKQAKAVKKINRRKDLWD